MFNLRHLKLYHLLGPYAHPSTECCLDALKKRIEERLRRKKSCTIVERDLAIIWPRDERDQLKREKEIHAFAAANGWLATILDPGIRVTFRKVGI
jgi:hypothetical protein